MAEHFGRRYSGQREQGLSAFDKPWAEHRVLEVRSRLASITDRVMLCYGARSQARDLGKYEPHPV